MTVCNLCKGTGKLLKPWYDTTGAMTGMTGDICFMCDGKGTIGEPQTNEEYLRSLNTEQLAELIALICGSNILLVWRIVYHCADSDVDAVKMWLKQPHTTEG